MMVMRSILLSWPLDSIQSSAIPQSVTELTFAATVSKDNQLPSVVLQKKYPLNACNFELYLAGHPDHEWGH